MRTIVLGTVVSAGLLAAGCADHPKEVNLKPQSFYAAQNATTRPVQAPAAPEIPPANLASNGKAGRVVVAAAASRATTRRSVGNSTGTYMVVGTVVAQANGVPIYADRVLSKLDAALSAKKDLDPQLYRAFATAEIDKQIKQEIEDQLEYAAAERNMSDDDRQLANALTYQWYNKEIIRHGGSEAITRDDYLHPKDGSQPISFDDKVLEQYRGFMVFLYLNRRVWPRVQVSVQDMQEYYDRYKNDRFTEKAGVLFRVIQFDVQRLGKDNAINKAEDVLKLAQAPNANFRELAARYNDDRDLARREGLVFNKQQKRDREGNAYFTDNGGHIYVKDAEGHLHPDDALSKRVDADEEKKLLTQITPLYELPYLDKGAYWDTKLEQTAFSMNNGQVAGPIIGDNQRFCYIVKLEDKRVGKVQSFGDPKVQGKIHDELVTRQRMELRLKERMKLAGTANYSTDPEAIKLAVDMAMQKYYSWARAE